MSGGPSTVVGKSARDGRLQRRRIRSSDVEYEPGLTLDGGGGQVKREVSQQLQGGQQFTSREAILCAAVWREENC